MGVNANWLVTHRKILISPGGFPKPVEVIDKNLIENNVNTTEKDRHSMDVSHSNPIHKFLIGLLNYISWFPFDSNDKRFNL